MKYLLGADIGTTSLKAVVFDENGTALKSVTKDYTLLVSGDEVEFPAEEYWRLFKEAYEEITAEYPVAALAVDTQCETMIVADEDGAALMNAIVWLDNRAAAEAEELRTHFGNRAVYETTGQPEVTATWPASKLLWLRKNRPEIFGRIKKVFLLEDYILFKLTGRFVTEMTLQSSTIYFDIRNRCWWKEMLDYIGIDEACFPALLGSGEPVGEYRGTAVVTGAMDQIAGAIGAGVIKKGVISEMTGTTMVVFVPDCEMPAYDPASIIPCHFNFDGRLCLLSWTPTAGIALKWFKNNFCENFSFRALDELAETVPPGSNGLSFIPYLCGSTMPKYDPQAKGAFMGLTMEHTRAHAVRSILEAVACMLKQNLQYLKLDCKEIRSMGGGAGSPLWCQIKADLTGTELVTLKNKETACLGSAILAGVGVGVYPSVEAACARTVALDRRYTPSGADYSACYENYNKAEERVLQK